MFPKSKSYYNMNTFLNSSANKRSKPTYDHDVVLVVSLFVGPDLEYATFLKNVDILQLKKYTDFVA